MSMSHSFKSGAETSNMPGGSVAWICVKTVSQVSDGIEPVFRGTYFGKLLGRICQYIKQL